jgi:hypothetical protein
MEKIADDPVNDGWCGFLSMQKSAFQTFFAVCCSFYFKDKKSLLLIQYV